jgi:hypothetical protein
MISFRLPPSVERVPGLQKEYICCVSKANFNKAGYHKKVFFSSKWWVTIQFWEVKCSS